MPGVSKSFWAVAALAVGACGGSLVSPAVADDTSSAKRPPSTLDQQINQAVGSGGSSSSDMDARIRDLEATRTEIDQQKKPAVSLSVSGWVDQQILYSVK